MRHKSGMLLIPAALVCLTSCSTLKVTPLDKDKGKGSGVPFYMTKNELRIVELDRDATGRETPNVQYQVALATVPDYSRAFRVENSPTWFANSGFSISRSSLGRMTGVSGSADDRTLETLSGIAGAIPGLAALASQDEGLTIDELKVRIGEAQDALEIASDEKEKARIRVNIKELESKLALAELELLKAKLVDRVNSWPATADQSAEELTALMANLASVEARILEHKKPVRGPIGSQPSQPPVPLDDSSAAIEVLADGADVESAARAILSNTPRASYAVVLVPFTK